jgi:hypothetical protein
VTVPFVEVPFWLLPLLAGALAEGAVDWVVRAAPTADELAGAVFVTPTAPGPRAVEARVDD